MEKVTKLVFAIMVTLSLLVTCSHAHGIGVDAILSADAKACMLNCADAYNVCIVFCKGDAQTQSCKKDCNKDMTDCQRSCRAAAR